VSFNSFIHRRVHIYTHRYSVYICTQVCKYTYLKFDTGINIRTSFGEAFFYSVRQSQYDGFVPRGDPRLQLSAPFAAKVLDGLADFCFFVAHFEGDRLLQPLCMHYIQAHPLWGSLPLINDDFNGCKDFSTAVGLTISDCAQAVSIAFDKPLCAAFVWAHCFYNFHSHSLASQQLPIPRYYLSRFTSPAYPKFRPLFD